MGGLEGEEYWKREMCNVWKIERESEERLLVDPASTVWRRRRGKGLEYISRGFSSRAVSRMDLSDSPRLV